MNIILYHICTTEKTPQDAASHERRTIQDYMRQNNNTNSADSQRASHSTLSVSLPSRTTTRTSGLSSSSLKS